MEITNVNIATSVPGIVAQGLNDAGEVVGRFRTNGAPANQTRGFIRRANGMFEPFDFPGVASTSISEINNHGHLVGETRNDLTAFGLIRGFVHSNGVSSEVHFPGAVLTRAYGINDAGDIVGQYQLEDAVSRPFLLRNGVYSQIVPANAPGGLASSIAFSISDNGRVLGTYRDQANVSKTWVMRADGSFEYPVLPGAGRVINNAGQIAGSFLDPTNANTATPYVATPFAPVTYQFSRLSLTNSAGDSANKINNRGQITGTVDGTDGVSRGYLYFDGRERERTGWTGSVFTEWEGINASGDLAGYYADPADPTGNTYRAFMRRANGTFQSIGWSGDANFNFTVDINDAGQVAGGSSTQGWVRNPDDSYVVFKMPGYQTSGAWGINNAGIAVGVAFPGFFNTANGLIYDTKADTGQIWNYPGAATTTLFGINNRGDIVGSFKQTAASAEVPFIRWTDGTTQVITFAEEPNIRIYGINDARVIVGRYLDKDKVNHSFLAYPTVPVKRYTVVRLDVPGAVHTTPNAINDAGVVAGEWYNADYTVNKGFTRAPDGTFAIIDPASGYSGMTVSGINNAGDLAGFMESDGYVRRGTNFTILQPPGAGATYGRDINDAGMVVGDATGVSRNFNWRHDGTNFTLLNIPGANESGFIGINNAGHILGYSVRAIVGGGVTNTVNSNWLLRGTNFTVITYPNATLNALLSISENGTILGLFRQAATGTRNRYFLYDRGEFTELEFAGDPAWGRYSATDLNVSGQIVGNFRTTNDVYHGFVAALEQPLPRFTFETFDVPNAKETLLSDIDNQGWLVGRYKDANDLSHGFFQDGNTLLKFNVTGKTSTFATGFDAVGRIVGFYRDAVNPDLQHGFLRQTNGTYVTIDSPGNTTTTYLWRINDAGQINGYHFENEPFFIRSFQREGDGRFTTNIVFPGSPIGTVTRGMNAAGVLTGWKWTDAFALQGVIVEGTNFTSVFSVPDWANTLPGDINNRGEIAGTVINADFSDRRGFFRTSDGRTSVFAPPGATEVEVFGLNDSGLIVGEYVDQAGKRHGFIASPAVGLDKGHTDIGIAFEDGAWDLHIHAESSDTEYEPGQAVLRFGAASEQPIPDSPNFQFLGDPGRSTWILPQVENESLLFLGLAAEEIEDGVFVNNSLRVELVSVEGPGNLFVWTLDPLGKPRLHFNSADGILSSQDFYFLRTGGHQDMNWAFSAPGTYRVGYRASGTLVAGNQFTQSDVAHYTFEVPEANLQQPPRADDSFVYNLIDLGTFGGTEFNTAIDVNNFGVVVGGSSLSNNIDHPIFRWENGILQNLGLFGGRTAGAEAISETGWIVGTTTTPAGDFEPYVPYRLGANLKFEPIPLILGAQNGAAQDVNDSGTAVGTLDLPNHSMRAFLSFTNAPTIDLGTFGGESSGAEGINNSGVIVGWAQLSNGHTRAFRHLGTGPLNAATDDLGTLGGNTSQAFAVSSTGKIVGRSRTTNGVQHAFLWEPGVGMSDLGSLGGDNTYAFGINTNDVVTGWGNLVPGGDPTHGWVWTRDNGLRDLNALIPIGAGLEVSLAYGVNEAGWIAGGAERLDNRSSRSVLLRPATRLSRGHTDLGALLQSGQLELEVHSEELDQEFEPGAALLRLPALTQTTVPTNTAFAFLGDAGAPVWILPQVQHPKLLFLGLAAEEIEKGVFVNDEIKFTLKKMEGPGHFFLYSVDGFRNPVIHWNSSDGLSANDAKVILAGGHEDMNWAFTAPGYYHVTIEASGTLVAGNQTLSSGSVTYHFEVIGIEPHMTLARGDATTLALTVTTEDGIVYKLQSAASVNGPWIDFGQPFIGTGRDKRFTVPIASDASFFRIFSEVGNF